MWKQSQRFDPARRVPFQAFAYRAVKGAMLMACRHYREETHEELKLKDHPVDTRPNAEQTLLESHPDRPLRQLLHYACNVDA